MKNFLLIQPKTILRRIYPKAIWNFARNRKDIYLTFDDGPIPGLTEWVLDELQRFNAKATFFCVGDNIRKYPSVFNRILEEGHRAANHTMQHPRGFRRNVSTYIKEVDDCRALVNNHLFRPPYGQMSPGQYRALVRKGYRIILWDVISYDYENISPEACAKNALRNTRPGSIVLFHDNPKAEKNLRYALPLFLAHFTEKGCGFKAIES